MSEEQNKVKVDDSGVSEKESYWNIGPFQVQHANAVNVFAMKVVIKGKEFAANVVRCDDKVKIAIYENGKEIAACYCYFGYSIAIHIAKNMLRTYIKNKSGSHLGRGGFYKKACKELLEAQAAKCKEYREWIEAQVELLKAQADAEKTNAEKIKACEEAANQELCEECEKAKAESAQEGAEL